MTNLARRPPFTTAFILGLVLVGAGAGVFGLAGGGGTVSAQAALNPCALLTTSEIQPLELTASDGDGVATALDAYGSTSCRYAWGVGVKRLKLNVIVNDASKMFPGMGAAQIKQRLQESVKAASADAAISDLGDAAVFTADSPYLATATAAIKGHILSVQVDGFIARDSKDHVIALLKAAASRL